MCEIPISTLCDCPRVRATCRYPLEETQAEGECHPERQVIAILTVSAHPAELPDVLDVTYSCTYHPDLSPHDVLQVLADARSELSVFVDQEQRPAPLIEASQDNPCTKDEP